MLPYELDIHTHTVSSGHYTRDTATDMIKYAARAGIKLLGISEHGPSIPHSCAVSYFRGQSLAPRRRMGIHVLYGAEVNITDLSGSLDLPPEIMKNLDYCMAGMHLPCLAPGTVQENTDAYIHAMESPYIRMVAHPDDIKYPVDYNRLMEAAMDCHVLLEINNSSLAPGGYRGNHEKTKENDRAILELCRKYRYPVLLSSDSHGRSHIGDFTYALSLIREINFPEELIINRSVDKFLHFLNCSAL